MIMKLFVMRKRGSKGISAFTTERDRISHWVIEHLLKVIFAEKEQSGKVDLKYDKMLSD